MHHRVMDLTPTPGFPGLSLQGACMRASIFTWHFNYKSTVFLKRGVMVARKGHVYMIHDGIYVCVV